MIPGTTYRIDYPFTALCAYDSFKPASGVHKCILVGSMELEVSINNDPDDEQLIMNILTRRDLRRLYAKNTSLETGINEVKVIVNKSDLVKYCSDITDYSSAIYFYTREGEYGWLSNFSEFGFEHKGVFYKTVEHYYQSKKFISKDLIQSILNSSSAKEAYNLGARSKPIVANWTEKRNIVMHNAIVLKFYSNPELLERLKKTKPMLIIENSPFDSYWGVGKGGTGFNHLGTLLMRVRDLNSAKSLFEVLNRE